LLLLHWTLTLLAVDDPVMLPLLTFHSYMLPAAFAVLYVYTLLPPHTTVLPLITGAGTVFTVTTYGTVVVVHAGVALDICLTVSVAEPAVVYNTVTIFCVLAPTIVAFVAVHK
jgi:hypothetical protein